jgi:hypothetical protein
MGSAWLVALSVIMLGAGIAIGAAIWSGGSSTTTVPAARNAAPAVPTEDNVGIAQTWSVPAGTHVTVTYSGSGHCTKNEKSLSFDTGAPPYRRTDTLYTRSIADVCRVQLSNAVFVIKTSTGQTRDLNVAQTTLKGLYETRCRDGNLACRDSGGGSRTTTPSVGLG